MGGPKGHMRGNKTHRADQLISRGNTELPEEAISEPENEDEAASSKQHNLADEHPTGRKTATGKTDSHSMGRS